MTFTKVTNTGIGSTGTILLQNLDVIGIVTAGFGVSTVDVFTTGITTFANATDSTSTTTGSVIVSGGVGIAGSLNVGGSVSVGGTLTYEDVTNVDSVGMITARTDITLGDSIIHLGDTNTKMRFPAADTITAETGGSERLRISSAGIGVTGNISVATTGNNQGVSIQATGSNYTSLTGNAARTGADEFLLNIRGLWNDTTVANILLETGSDTTNKDDGVITFRTKPSGATITERLRITSSGLVGIGTDSPTARLEIIDSKVRTYDPTSQTELLVERAGNCIVSIVGRNDSNCILNFGDNDDENVGYIDYDHADNSMQFRTNAVERLRINTEGYVKGNVNIPCWYGRQDSTHAVGNGAWTTVRNLGSYAVNPSMNNGGWDESTGIFTAQAGQAGTYYVYGQAAIDDVMDNDVVRAGFSKNDGTVPSYSQTRCLDQGSNVIVNSGLIAQTVELAVGDTIKLQVYHNEGDSQNTEAIYTFFGGYRIST